MVISINELNKQYPTLKIPTTDYSNMHIDGILSHVRKFRAIKSEIVNELNKRLFNDDYIPIFRPEFSVDHLKVYSKILRARFHEANNAYYKRYMSRLADSNI